MLSAGKLIKLRAINIHPPPTTSWVCAPWEIICDSRCLNLPDAYYRLIYVSPSGLVDIVCSLPSALPKVLPLLLECWRVAHSEEQINDCAKRLKLSQHQMEMTWIAMSDSLKLLICFRSTFRINGTRPRPRLKPEHRVFANSVTIRLDATPSSNLILRRVIFARVKRERTKYN